MRSLVLGLLLSVVVCAPAAAQSVCAAPPLRNSVVQFFERWYDAVDKLRFNAAFGDTATLLPVTSGAKSGYVLVFDQMVSLDNNCPPQPAVAVEKSTPGWNRRTIDTPALAEAFIAGLSRGTPVVISTLHAGYAAGVTTTPRMRGVTHEVVFAPRGMIVVWFDETAN